MNINEIAKEMTREEFLSYIDEEGWLVLPKKFNINPIDCPYKLKLKDFGNTDIQCDISKCKRCWAESIKNIKFKDDLEKENNINMESKIFKETIKEVVNSRLYYGDEILKLIRENKIIKGQEFYIYYNNVKQIGITVKWNGENFISSDNIKLDVIKFLHFQFQFIKKEYLDFEGAISISGLEGLRLKHKDWDSYVSRQDIMDMIVYSIESKRMSVKDLNRKVWEVEE